MSHSTAKHVPIRWRPRLRSIVLLVNLLILTLVVTGFALTRVYESAIIRQTEASLIAQGAAIAAVFRAEMRLLVRNGHPPVAQRLLPAKPQKNPWAPWNPVPPKLNLAADDIHPPAPDAETATSRPTDTARRIGNHLSGILKDAQATTLAGIRVLDINGVVLATTSGEQGQSLNNRYEVRQALNGQYSSLLRQRSEPAKTRKQSFISRRTALRVFITMPIIDQGKLLGVVALSRTPPSLSQVLYEQRYQLMAWAGSLLLVVILVSVLLSISVNRPIRALIREAKRFGSGEHSELQPLQKPITREIAELSDTLVQMAGDLSERGRYIRNFARHVSHGFKTPLTAIQGATELLQDHADSMSTEERSRFIDNIHDDVARLQRLVERLLELARADTLEIGKECCDVGRVIEEAASQGINRGLSIDYPQALKLPKIRMDGDTLSSILATLVENAEKHGATAEHSAIHIRISAEHCKWRGKLGIKIQVADNGQGVSAQHRPHIFEPLFTTASASGGTGIGLAVVHSLVETHGGDIQLLDIGVGAIFEIRLVAEC